MISAKSHNIYLVKKSTLYTIFQTILGMFGFSALLLGAWAWTIIAAAMLGVL